MLHRTLSPIIKCDTRGHCCKFSLTCTCVNRRGPWSCSLTETCTCLKRRLSSLLINIVSPSLSWDGFFRFATPGDTPMSGWSKAVDLPLWWQHVCVRTCVHVPWPVWWSFHGAAGQSGCVSIPDTGRPSWCTWAWCCSLWPPCLSHTPGGRTHWPAVCAGGSVAQSYTAWSA